MTPASVAKSGKGDRHDHEFHPESLWLIPAFLAVGFMLWVLWNLHKAE